MALAPCTVWYGAVMSETNRKMSFRTGAEEYDMGLRREQPYPLPPVSSFAVFPSAETL